MKNVAKVLVLALGLAVLTGAHCNAKKTLADIVDCTAAKLKEQLPDLAEQAIKAALSQNWMSELWILAQAVGPALACVEQEILEALKPVPPASQPATKSLMAVKSKMPAGADTNVVAKRLQQHLDSRYWAK